MDMHVPTESDTDTYPHVFLTADALWDPNIIDDEFYLDDSMTFMDDSAIQQCQFACDYRIDNYWEIYSSAHNPLY